MGDNQPSDESIALSCSSGDKPAGSPVYPVGANRGNDAYDKLKLKNPYKYKYDENGNMTEQVEYVIMGGKEVMQNQTIWEYEFYTDLEK
ncbi:MAG: hypothetical protein V1871_00050 [Planctomycetota bacterium]